MTRALLAALAGLVVACTGEAKLVSPDSGPTGGAAGDAAFGGAAGTGGSSGSAAAGGSSGAAGSTGGDGGVGAVDGGPCASINAPTSECQTCLMGKCGPQVSACESDKKSGCSCGSYGSATGQVNCMLDCMQNAAPDPQGKDSCAKQCGESDYNDLPGTAKNVIDCALPKSPGAIPECPCFKKPNR